MRILFIELRRSVALWAAVTIAGIGLFVLFTSNPPYRSWLELAIVQRDIMQLTWPLALAAGAWQGIRERRSRVEELIGTTPRPRWQRVLPVASAMAIAAGTAYLVMFAGASMHLRHPAAFFPIGAAALILLGALAMVAAVWLGQALGALRPSSLTPPMVAVMGVVAVALLPGVLLDGPRPGAVLMLPSLQGPRDAGWAVRTLSTPAVVSQTVWFAAVAATGFALFATAGAGTRLAALLPIVLGAAIIAPILPDRVADAWVEDPRATALVCTRDEPQVCISRAHSYALEYVRGPAREALSVLAARVPESPTRVVVRDAGNGIPPDPQSPDEIQVYISIFDDIFRDYAPGNLLDAMLAGAGTRPCVNQAGYDPTKFGEPQPNIRYPAAREVAIYWLLDTSPELPGKPDDAGDDDPQAALVARTLTALRALPADLQRDRVVALRAAELTCVHGDRIELLTSGGAR